jgi:hypothetical protein
MMLSASAAIVRLEGAMRGQALMAVLLALGGSVFAVEAAERLTGDTLRRAVSGKTVYFRTPVAEIPIRYRPNGSIHGATSASLAALGGESVSSDTGRWWVVRERLCQQWKNWLDGRSYCYKFRIADGTVQWQRHDGVTGTARIVSQ